MFADMDIKKLMLFCAAAVTVPAAADEFEKVPSSWKWVSDSEVVFSYDGSYADSAAFSYDVRKGKVNTGVSAPEKYSEFPLEPEGAVNMTYSPDSTMIAYTAAKIAEVRGITAAEVLEAGVRNARELFGISG